jgi:ATP-dependent DNA ligase
MASVPRKTPRAGAMSLTEAKHRWVEPKLVFKAAFVEWTHTGHLRHCTFIAMGYDKGSRGFATRLPCS